MPALTITLTDAQWAAYQAASSNISLADATAWLKLQLDADYKMKLERIDMATADGVFAESEATRYTKIDAF